MDQFYRDRTRYDPRIIGGSILEGIDTPPMSEEAEDMLLWVICSLFGALVVWLAGYACALHQLPEPRRVGTERGRGGGGRDMRGADREMETKCKRLDTELQAARQEVRSVELELRTTLSELAEVRVELRGSRVLEREVEVRATRAEADRAIFQQEAHERAGSLQRELEGAREGRRVAEAGVADLEELVGSLETIVGGLRGAGGTATIPTGAGIGVGASVQATPRVCDRGCGGDVSVPHGYRGRYWRRACEEGVHAVLREGRWLSPKFVVAAISSHSRAGEYGAALRIYRMAQNMGISNRYVETSVRRALTYLRGVS